MLITLNSIEMVWVGALPVTVMSLHSHLCVMSRQVSLDQYHTEEEIYQMSLQREPRSSKPAVSRAGGGACLKRADIPGLHWGC